MTLRLFFVGAHTDGGDNYDLFVWAKTHEHALALWEAHCLNVWGEHPYTIEGLDIVVYVVPTKPPTNAKSLNWYEDVEGKEVSMLLPHTA